MKFKTICAFAAVFPIVISSVAWAAGIVTVDQRGLAFSVATLSVNKGDVVTFNNNDSTSHNIIVTGQGVRLNSGLQAPGVAFKAPFFKAGIYEVICGIHPRMKVAVTVR